MEKHNGTALTRFGAVVLSLMAERGVTTVAGLCAVLADHGKEYKRSRISNWLYGKHPADAAFCQAMDAVLELREEERVKLALAFTFGQHEHLGVGQRT